MRDVETSSNSNSIGNGVDKEDLIRAISVLIERANSAHIDGSVGKPTHKRKRKLSAKSQKVVDLLSEGWHDIGFISREADIAPNRIHMILSYLRGHGANVKSKNVKRYHLLK